MTATQTDDWWDRLYADDTSTSSPQARPVSKAQTRLPSWWEAKTDLTTPAEDQDEAEDQGQEEGNDEEESTEEPDDDPEPKSDDEDQAVVDATPKSSWFIRQTGYWPTPTPTRLPAKPALSNGTKRLLYNTSAAGTGYYLGLAPTIGDLIESCGQETSIGGALVLGAGICLGIAAMWDCRTRHWYRPLAWTARIPLASALTALALYAPASQI